MVTDNRLVEDPPEPMADMSAWEVLGVPKEVQRGLSEQSFTTLTPLQTLSLLPAIFHHRDIIGAAETGSGKTLAFGIPILTHILGHKSSQEAGETTENTTKNNATEATETGNGTSKLKKPLLALIMTPTRELVIQIKNHLKQAAKHTSLEIVAVVGGMAPQKQQRLLNKCPEIIVATPGRLWDLISELYIHCSGRTARASREGLSVVLVGPEEMGSYKKIMKTLNGGKRKFTNGECCMVNLLT
nr:ATP-dependent RNA helicase DDX24-like [Pocillopora verrucosa]